MCSMVCVVWIKILASNWCHVKHQVNLNSVGALHHIRIWLSFVRLHLQYLSRWGMTSFTLTCRINRCYITLGDVFKHGSSCWFLWEISNLIDFLLAFLLEPLPRNLLVIPLATGHRSWCLRWCHRRFDLQFHQAFGWCFLHPWMMLPYQVWLYDGQGPEIPPSHGGWHRIYFSGEHLVFFVAWQSWNAVPQQFVFSWPNLTAQGMQTDGMPLFHSMTPVKMFGSAGQPFG